MMYYIESPYTVKAANRKCEELYEFIWQFNHCLIADDLSRDALILDISRKVIELNAAYPRTKELVVRRGINDNNLICHPETRTSDSDTVFTITFHPVRRTYQFAEQLNILEEGGQK